MFNQIESPCTWMLPTRCYKKVARIVISFLRGAVTQTQRCDRTKKCVRYRGTTAIEGRPQESRLFCDSVSRDTLGIR
jgi:hypothetical protein